MTRLHVAAVVVLSLLPAAAIAHSPIKGLDNFYAGFLHPLFVPAHLLPILVLGLLFGQQGPARLQTAIIVFLVAVVGGLAATLLSPACWWPCPFHCRWPPMSHWRHCSA